MILYYSAAILIVVTAIFHSWRGEKLLIIPTLNVDDPFIKRDMTQAITRFAWHAASLFMLLSALLLVYPNMPEAIKCITGILWLVLGVANLIMTKAKHPGGTLLSVIAILILCGYFL